MVKSVEKDGVELSVIGVETLFALSPLGDLRINPMVDRETASRYSVVVTAVDRGEKSAAWTSTKALTVFQFHSFDKQSTVCHVCFLPITLSLYQLGISGCGPPFK